MRAAGAALLNVGRRLLTLLRRHPGQAIELDVVQQLTVLTLLRFGDCTFVRLQAELEAIRGTKPAEMVMAVMKLEQENMLERLNRRTESRLASSFRLTPMGRRLGRRIPRPPRSPVIIYL